MVDALLVHAGRHGAAHHVARRQLVDEALALPVAQERAVAAQRLGEQGSGHGGVVQRRRVELDELDVGGRHAGPERHRHAVAGRLGRVGGDREELTGATGGQHDMIGSHLDRAAGATGRQRQHADTAPALDEEVEGEPAFEHRAGRTVGGVDQRSLHLRPRGRPARVDDPRPGVATLTGEGEGARRLAVELDAERDELVHAPGPLVDQDAHGLLVAQAGARRQRVGQVEVGRVLVAAQHRRDPALGPARRRLRQRTLGQHAEGQGGEGAPGPARRTAADSPATPLPRTRTSKGPGRAPAVTPVRSA